MAVDETPPPKRYSPKQLTEWFPCWSVKTIQRRFSDRKRHPDVYHSGTDTGVVINGNTRKQKDHLAIPMAAINREIAYGTTPPTNEPARRITPRRRKLKPRCKLYVGVGTIRRGKPASQSAAV